MQRNYFKYLSIKQFEERWGIYVTATGYSKVDPNDSYPNAVHPQSHHLTWNRGRILNDYYIIFISKGKGVFASAVTDSAEVVAGTCFFLYPGLLHRYRPDRWDNPKASDSLQLYTIKLKIIKMNPRTAFKQAEFSLIGRSA